MKHLITIICLFALAPFARAQDVLVVWGDSVMTGWASHNTPGTPWGGAPFGGEIPATRRWHNGQWIPVTPLQNFHGLGADPVYGLAHGWRRFNSAGEWVYIVALGVPGSDCNPAGGHASWHPHAQGAWMLASLMLDLQAALATLPDPDIRAIFFCTGNNDPSPTLVQDIEAVNEVIGFADPDMSTTITQIGVRTWIPCSSSTNTSANRAALPLWAATAPADQRRLMLDATSFPARTWGMPDCVHLSEFGCIFLGYYAAFLEFIN